MEPWHALVEAWQAEDQPALMTTIARIAAFGATSGADALAGFINVFLGPAQYAISLDN